MSRCLRWLLLPWALAAVLGPPPGPAAGQPTLKRAPPELTEKESFMLMFGKGNGAMRVLCAMERDGVISPGGRRRYAERLEELLMETADSARDRRNARIGMAFADGRPSLCATRILSKPKAKGASTHP